MESRDSTDNKSLPIRIVVRNFYRHLAEKLMHDGKVITLTKPEEVGD
jgi:hypothetical protein